MDNFLKQHPLGRSDGLREVIQYFARFESNWPHSELPSVPEFVLMMRTLKNATGVFDAKFEDVVSAVRELYPELEAPREKSVNYFESMPNDILSPRLYTMISMYFTVNRVEGGMQDPSFYAMVKRLTDCTRSKLAALKQRLSLQLRPVLVHLCVIKERYTAKQRAFLCELHRLSERMDRKKGHFLKFTFLDFMTNCDGDAWKMAAKLEAVQQQTKLLCNWKRLPDDDTLHNMINVYRYCVSKPPPRLKREARSAGVAFRGIDRGWTDCVISLCFAGRAVDCFRAPGHGAIDASGDSSYWDGVCLAWNCGPRSKFGQMGTSRRRGLGSGMTPSELLAYRTSLFLNSPRRGKFM